jgi:hypothetical protein
MDSTPRLRADDRPEFEGVLDEALHSEEIQSRLRGSGTALDSEQLRTLTLRAAEMIATAAAPEYGAYVALLDREHAASGADGDRTAAGGAGLVPLLAVLVPFLAGIAALLLLALGYGLRAAGGIAIAGPLIASGLIAAGVCVAALVVAAVGLLLTAVRGGSASRGGRVAEARAAWRSALRDRGVLPYLRRQLADQAPGDGGGGDATSEPPGRESV